MSLSRFNEFKNNIVCDNVTKWKYLQNNDFLVTDSDDINYICEVPPESNPDSIKKDIMGVYGALIAYTLGCNVPDCKFFNFNDQIVVGYRYFSNTEKINMNNIPFENIDDILYTQFVIKLLGGDPDLRNMLIDTETKQVFIINFEKLFEGLDTQPIFLGNKSQMINAINKFNNSWININLENLIPLSVPVSFDEIKPIIQKFYSEANRLNLTKIVKTMIANR